MIRLVIILCFLFPSVSFANFSVGEFGDINFDTDININKHTFQCEELSITPSNPSANKLKFYCKDNAGVTALYTLDSSGNEVLLGSGGGSSTIYDLGDDGGNDSTALGEIAITGDTNGIFSEPSADKALIAVGNDWPKADTADDLTCTNCIGPTEITDLTLGTDTAGNYAAGDSEAGAATSGDSATSFFSTGTLEDTLISSALKGWTDGGTNVYASSTTDNVGIGTTTPTAALLVENAGTQDSFRVNDDVLDSSPFIIMPDGNVGMGTTTPGEKVHIAGGNLLLNNNMYLKFKNAAGANNTTLGIFTDNILYMDGNAGINFRGNGTGTGVRIVAASNNVGIGTTTPVGGLAVMNGNVGIGTWSPTSELQVVGTVAATAFSGDGSGLTGISAGGWVDGGTNIYTSTTSDNVAIGTTTPSGALEIIESGEAPLMVSSVPAGDGDFLLVDSTGNIGIGTTDTLYGGLSVMNGNVGIGTWKPIQKLDVAGSIRTRSSSGNSVLTSTTLTLTSSSPAISGVSSSGGGLIITGGSVGSGDLTLKSTSASGTTDTIRFLLGSNGATEAMRMQDNSGTVNIGIGTDMTSAAAKLVVLGGNVGIGTITPVNGTSFMNGNVGIGTWSPSHPLLVRPVVSGSGIKLSETDSANGAVTLEATSSSGMVTVHNSNSNSIRLNGASNATTYFNSPGINIGIGTLTAVDGVAIMNGNVGIGTWSPTSALQVVGTVASTAFSGDGSALTGIAAGGGWVDGGTNVYTATTTDNVGIGTTTPLARLHVAGTGNTGIGTALPSAKLEVKGTFTVRGAQTSPWTVKTGANVACNTTCGTSMCAFGVDDTDKLPLACSGATADTCVCMGP